MGAVGKPEVGKSTTNTPLYTRIVINIYIYYFFLKPGFPSFVLFGN